MVFRNTARLSLIAAILYLSAAHGTAQCKAPELIQGYDSYNELVCRGIQKLSNNAPGKALGDFLAASKKPTTEYPNNLLFGRIAMVYADLGQFEKAEVYLEYDSISILWSMGVVRCRASKSSDQELLYQDGVLMKSSAAMHMSNVLCGEIYDNNAYLGDVKASALVPVARAILAHAELQKQIAAKKLRGQKAPTK